MDDVCETVLVIAGQLFVRKVFIRTESTSCHLVLPLFALQGLEHQVCARAWQEDAARRRVARDEHHSHHLPWRSVRYNGNVSAG